MRRPPSTVRHRPAYRPEDNVCKTDSISCIRTVCPVHRPVPSIITQNIAHTQARTRARKESASNANRPDGAGRYEPDSPLCTLVSMTIHGSSLAKTRREAPGNSRGIRHSLFRESGSFARRRMSTTCGVFAPADRAFSGPLGVLGEERRIPGPRAQNLATCANVGAPGRNPWARNNGG